MQNQDNGVIRNRTLKKTTMLNISKEKKKPRLKISQET